jgi:hypothetical protein
MAKRLLASRREVSFCYRQSEIRIMIAKEITEEIAGWDKRM